MVLLLLATPSSDAVDTDTVGMGNDLSDELEKVRPGMAGRRRGERHDPGDLMVREKPDMTMACVLCCAVLCARLRLRLLLLLPLCHCRSRAAAFLQSEPRPSCARWCIIRRRCPTFVGFGGRVGVINSKMWTEVVRGSWPAGRVYQLCGGSFEGCWWQWQW